MSRERELLEQALEYLPTLSVTYKEISDFLSAPEPKQCEVCGEGKVIEMRYWLCDSCRSEYSDADQIKFTKVQTVKARTPEPKQDEEPVAEVSLMVTGGNAGLATVIHEIYNPEREALKAGDKLYIHPVPRKPFVRLSEEEVSQILSSAHTPYEAVCATENRLVEKNK